MIYVSSSSVKKSRILESIQVLVDSGFSNIELSGGTEYYEEIGNDLEEIKQKLGLNLICHNYFPPPKVPFVLNLASENDLIYEATLSHLKEAIRLTKNLGGKRFAFHAGFYIDIEVKEIGKKISSKQIKDKEKSLSKFCKGFEILLKESDGIDLYIENNVISNSNFKSFGNTNPLMLTNMDEYFELKRLIPFNILLDFAHLKVSCNTLNRNFFEEAKALSDATDYLHLSDNNGEEDQNKFFSAESEMASILKSINLKNKTITLEVYENMDLIQMSFNNLKSII